MSNKNGKSAVDDEATSAPPDYMFILLSDLFKEARTNPAKFRNEILGSLPELARDMCRVTEPFLPLAATAKISHILTCEGIPFGGYLAEDSPIDKVIQHDIIPHLVRFLQPQQYTPLRVLAAKALRAILCNGSPEQAQVVLVHGGVAAFVGPLSSEDEDLKYEASLAVGSAASISLQFRQTLFEHGAFLPLVTLLEQHSEPPLLQKSLQLMRTSANTLKNLCSGGPAPEIDQFEVALPTLRKLINLNPHDAYFRSICEDVCWTLSYVSRGSINRIQAIVNADLCRRLVTLLQNANSNIVHAILGIVGNFLTSIDPHVQVMIDNQVFPILRQILEHHLNPNEVLKTTCSIISGFVFGIRPRVQIVLDANLIPPLLRILQDHVVLINDEVRWEAARVVANVVIRGSFEQINFLVLQGCIRPLCRYLLCEDTGIQRLCVAGLWNILMKGREHEEVLGANPYAVMVRDAGGFDSLYSLWNDDHAGEMARTILNNFNK